MASPALTVVIPSRDRKDVLLETLSALERDAHGVDVDAVVISDGSIDGTVTAATGFADSSEMAIEVLEQPPRGPAAARNLGIAAATARACLFLGDDVRPRAGLLGSHADFHARRPEPEAALLGRVVPAPPLDRSEFVRWLHTGGVQFGYGSLRSGRQAPPESFWTANVSVKTELLRRAGGFDEAFPGAACEDAELGMRLAGLGMRLHYDAAAVAEHYHPADLDATLERMRVVGESFRILCRRAPGTPMPSRPGMRHRVKAIGIRALVAAGVRSGAVRQAGWRFVCDEAQREAYWGIEAPAGRRLAIGEELLQLIGE